jgi:predicted RNase H-like HicB family nuclease
MTTLKKTITLSYQLYPEHTGYSVKCLDWNVVFTQGEDINECKRNAKEATNLFLRDMENGTLHKADYPKIRARKKHTNLFRLKFQVRVYK